MGSFFLSVNIGFCSKACRIIMHEPSSGCLFHDKVRRRLLVQACQITSLHHPHPSPKTFLQNQFLEISGFHPYTDNLGYVYRWFVVFSNLWILPLVLPFMHARNIRKYRCTGSGFGGSLFGTTQGWCSGEKPAGAEIACCVRRVRRCRRMCSTRCLRREL